MQDGTYVIGRARQPDAVGGATRAGHGGKRRLELADPTVSERHAELIVLDGECFLRDLGSRNGTWTVRDGERERIEADYVSPGQPLLFGDCPATIDELLAGSGLSDSG